VENQRTELDEEIQLAGGPFDGEKFWWRGDEEIRFSLSSPAELKSNTWLPVIMPPRDIIYRRSMVTRSLFVFQP
jgi:hypothetical protein